MATRPPHLGGSSTREISPFLSLPNEDGSNPHQEHYADQSLQQNPPTTLSCAQCERIVGDSSAFLFVTRQMGTVTLDRVVSVGIGAGGLKTSPEGEWDEFCNYKDISCGKCTTTLGKMYFATTSKLSALQNKHTLCITALSFYQHGSDSPSLPIAATNEIYAQLNPDPDSLLDSIDRVETMCVVLREEQMIIIRELRRLAAVAGVDVDLEDSGAGGEKVYIGGGWTEEAQALDEDLGDAGCVFGAAEDEEREKGREASVLRLGLGEEMLSKELKGKGKLGRKKGRPSLSGPPTAPQQQEKKLPRALSQPVTAHKRKRKSDLENSIVATADKKMEYIDLVAPKDSESPPQSRSQHTMQKEVPNSQSASEEEAHVEPAKHLPKRGGFDSYEEHEEESGTTEEEVDAIKSPAEKRRRAATIPKKGGFERRTRRGYK